MEELPEGKIQKILLQSEAFCVLDKWGGLVFKLSEEEQGEKTTLTLSLFFGR